MASIYRKEGSPFYWIGYYVNGERKDKSLKVRNKEIALRLRNQLEGQLALGEAGMAGVDDISYDKYNTIFIDHMEKKKRSPRTIDEYRGTIKRLTEYLRQECPSVKMLSQIKRHHIEKYLSSRSEAITGVRLNGELRYLQRYFNVAKNDLNHLKNNPTDGIEKAKETTKPRRIYSEDDIRLMLVGKKKLMF